MCSRLVLVRVHRCTIGCARRAHLCLRASSRGCVCARAQYAHWMCAGMCVHAHAIGWVCFLAHNTRTRFVFERARVCILRRAHRMPLVRRRLKNMGETQGQRDAHAMRIRTLRPSVVQERCVRHSVLERLVTRHDGRQPHLRKSDESSAVLQNVAPLVNLLHVWSPQREEMTAGENRARGGTCSAFCALGAQSPTVPRYGPRACSCQENNTTRCCRVSTSRQCDEASNRACEQGAPAFRPTVHPAL